VEYEESGEQSKLVPFWFPATTGLVLLAERVKKPGITAAILFQPELEPGEATSSFLSVQVNVSFDGEEQLKVMGNRQSAHSYRIEWEAQQRLLWLDSNGRPLKMQRGDGLTAVATQLVEYRKHD
jgi:hypothetical protein